MVAYMNREALDYTIKTGAEPITAGAEKSSEKKANSRATSRRSAKSSLIATRIASSSKLPSIQASATTAINPAFIVL